METDNNNLVLVHIDDKPAFYARIETISPDVKKGWYQVKLLVLTVPLQVYTWILDESQIAGAPFTMGGTPVRLELVISPVPPPPAADRHNNTETNPGPRLAPAKQPAAKVVSLTDRKKDK